MTVDDLNASFRGDDYGERPSMNAESFRSHVERNDVDLARSRRWTVDGALSGVVLLAFRGERAWIGGFGVVPEFRGRGLARRYLDETLGVARASGATSLELEVLTHNLPAIRLYERAGRCAVRSAARGVTRSAGCVRVRAAARAREPARRSRTRCCIRVGARVRAR